MKALALVLVGIVVLGGVGLAFGARRDRGGPVEPEKSALAGLLRPLTRATEVDLGELEGGCEAPGTAIARRGAPCRFSLPAGKREGRLLRVRLAEGERARLVYQPGEGASLATTVRLGRAEETTFNVPRGGASWTFVCEVGERCRLAP